MHITTWIPNPEALGHAGSPLAADDDFFAPPPAEIGEVVSAHTGLKQSVEPTATPRARFRAVLIAGGTVCGLMWLLSQADWKPEQIPGLRLATLIAVSCAVVIAWLVRKPRYTCSYVGTRGLARFGCYGSRNRMTLQEVFVFGTAESLEVSTRNIYVNGCYVNTEYSFRWRNSSRGVVYSIAGIHRSRQGKPSADDPYLLARAAELAWSRYLEPTVLASIEHGSAYRFRAGRHGYVDVGPESIDLDGKQIPYSDLDLAVERGFIVFRRRGDKTGWYRLDRASRVRYGDVDNALLMLRVVEGQAARTVRVTQLASDARYHLPHVAR